MAEAGGASTRAAPRELKAAARRIARRTEEAGGASTRAAPSQSFKLQAAHSARYVCGAHSRSLMVRRRSKPQHARELAASLREREAIQWLVKGLRIHQFTTEARNGLLKGCVRTHP
jgi:hypothetical protein